MQSADIQGKLISEGTYGKIYNVKSNPNFVMKVPKLEKYDQNIESIMMMEISSLKSLRGCNNIVQLDRILYDNHNIPILVMHKYPHDLSTILPVQDIQLRSFMFDICNGVLAIHNMGLYHLDIKPSNLMFGNGRIYIGDFGLAKKAFPSPNEIMNCLAQAIFCRAPEILISGVFNTPCVYSYAADIWSIGIVMYFLKTGIYPFTGDTELDILRKILKFFGLDPSTKFDSHIIENLDKIKVKSIEQHFQSTKNPYELHFLTGLLHPNPNIRFTMLHIFDHPYFSPY